MVTASRASVSLAFIVVAVLAGCGPDRNPFTEDTTPPDDTGTEDTTIVDTGVDAVADTGREAPLPDVGTDVIDSGVDTGIDVPLVDVPDGGVCPATLPVGGTMCMPFGTVCLYFPDPCGVRCTCGSSGWLCGPIC